MVLQRELDMSLEAVELVYSRFLAILFKLRCMRALPMHLGINFLELCQSLLLVELLSLFKGTGATVKSLKVQIRLESALPPFLVKRLLEHNALLFEVFPLPIGAVLHHVLLFGQLDKLESLLTKLRPVGGCSVAFGVSLE